MGEIDVDVRSLKQRVTANARPFSWGFGIAALAMLISLFSYLGLRDKLVRESGATEGSVLTRVGKLEEEQVNRRQIVYSIPAVAAKVDNLDDNVRTLVGSQDQLGKKVEALTAQLANLTTQVAVLVTRMNQERKSNGKGNSP